MRKIFFILFFLLFSFNVAQAQMEGDLSITPKVIDDSAAAREILEYSVSLKNNTTHKLNIYPLLEELQKEEKKNTAGLLERQYRMVEWISIKRNAIEIMPGEEISLPIKIDISFDAIPDEYFVSITFANGSHRVEAEENAIKTSPPKLFINLKVEDQTVEKASILKYNPTKKIFIDPRPSLVFDINNSGNVEIAPKGNIYFFNKRGEEVDVADINPDLKVIGSGKVSSFEIKTNNNLKTGRYKARLEIEYGERSVKEIQDTVYIVVVTLPFLLFFGIGIFLFIILLSTLIFKKTYTTHQQSPQTPNHHVIKVTRKENRSEGVINLKSK